MYCAADFPVFNGFNFFDVWTVGWPENERGCERGILDNVRGQTSGAEGGNWRCEEIPGNGDGRTVHRMSFTVSTAYLKAGTSVSNAIKLASPGGDLGVACTFYTLKSNFDWTQHHDASTRSCLYQPKGWTLTAYGER